MTTLGIARGKVAFSRENITAGRVSVKSDGEDEDMPETGVEQSFDDMAPLVLGGRAEAAVSTASRILGYVLLGAAVFGIVVAVRYFLG